MLWSEWSKNGWLIRSEVFAHIPGGGDVQTGNEPLFLWLRLRVLDPGTAPPAKKGQDFDLILQSPHLSTDMSMWNNVTYQPVFRGSLSKDRLHIPPLQGLNLVKVNGRTAWSGGARVVALGTEFGVKPTSGRNP